MKYIYFFLLLLTTVSTLAQLPQPALLSMQGIGGENTENIQFTRIIETYDSGFIVTFQTLSAGGNINVNCSDNSMRYVFNKYNSDGSILQWQKCESYLPDTSYRHLFPLPSGSYVFGGGSYVNGVSAQNFMIKKEDASGNLLWEKQYGGSSSELLRDMGATEDGGYIMLGTSASVDGDVGFNYNPPFNDDIWVLKLDSNGTKQWGTVLGGSQSEQAYQVLPVAGGGCYVIGSTSSFDHDCVGNHGQIDLFIARLDDMGGKVWTKCYGGSDREAATRAWAIVNSKGGLTLATGATSANGDVTNPKGLTDYWVLDIDNNGNVNWSQCYGSPASEVPYGMCKATDGTLWITGLSSIQGGDVATNYGKTDVWTIQTDSVGNLLSAKVMGSSETDRGLVIQPLSSGGVLVAGIYGASGAGGGSLPGSYNGGLSDVFIARFAPWTTGIGNVQDNPFPMQIYPNPATKELFIEPEKGNAKYDVIITDAGGKTVYRENGIKGKKAVGITGWSKGVYYLKAVAKDQAVYSTQVVIQ